MWRKVFIYSESECHNSGEQGPGTPKHKATNCKYPTTFSSQVQKSADQPGAVTNSWKNNGYLCSNMIKKKKIADNF